MSKEPKPRILVVDDRPDELVLSFSLEFNDSAVTSVLHPADVEMADLVDADLVLIDYRLEDWSERDCLSTITLQPSTGMGLAVILREHADDNKTEKLTAFALHTAHLGDIQGRLPPETAQHVLAHLNNLEWVFTKNEPNRYYQMIILANAMKQLPFKWPNKTDASARMVKKLLGIEKDTVRNRQRWQDVTECRVPLNELTEGGHDVLFIRWLLHQVFPYPCFLWSKHWVAARLGISLCALDKVLSGTNDLAIDINSMKYKGVLEGFLGERWWRTSLEEYVWKIGKGRTFDAESLHSELVKRAGMDLDMLDANPAVVSFDSELRPTDNFLSPNSAVVVRPDYWPAFADSAWMDIETVRDNSRLQTIVDVLDIGRIKREEN